MNIPEKEVSVWKRLASMIGDLIEEIREAAASFRAAKEGDGESTKGEALVCLIVSIAKVIVPLLLILALVFLLMYVLKHYLNYIIGMVFLITVMASSIRLKSTKRITPKEKVQKHYARVRSLIYSPLCELVNYLPVRRPQAVEDIDHDPEVEAVGRTFVLRYQLAKTTSEITDMDELDFARKIIFSGVKKSLWRYEKVHGKGTAHVDGIPFVTLYDIQDFGTHYCISVVFVHDAASYELAKACYRLGDMRFLDMSVNREDEDF